MEKEESKKVDETTKENNSAPEENKPEGTVDETTQNNEPEGKEETQLTPEEIKKLKKKAADFDGLVEKQRLAKLEQKKDDLDNAGENSNEVMSEIKKLREEIGLFKKESKKSSLQEAYKDFVVEHKWANDDEIFSKISENFDSGENLDKDSMLKNLKKAALMTYPDLYEKGLAEKVKSQTDTENYKLGIGGNAGGSGEMKDKITDGSNVSLKPGEEKIFNRFNQRRKARGEKPVTAKEFMELSQ